MSGAELVGHAWHYGDDGWSIVMRDGARMSGTGSRDDMRAELRARGLIATGWRSVPGVAYDAPDGRPIYADQCRVYRACTCPACAWLLEPVGGAR